TLTLEERATCPTTCRHWRDCYGNKMHRAQRWQRGPWETVSNRDDFAVTAFDQSSQGGNHMKTNLKRRPNGELRKREYLTEAEVERLIKAAKTNRYGQRDATMILLCFRHGLRASEIVDLRWEQVELGRNAALHVQRVKQGLPSVHPLQGDEMRALRNLKRDVKSPFVFVSERNAPFTTAGFAKLIERAGIAAKLGFKAHPHMLRHACGYALANAGHDTRALQAYLGHKNIQHTVRYTELSPTRFKNFWR